MRLAIFFDLPFHTGCRRGPPCPPRAMRTTVASDIIYYIILSLRIDRTTNVSPHVLNENRIRNGNTNSKQALTTGPKSSYAGAPGSSESYEWYGPVAVRRAPRRCAPDLAAPPPGSLPSAAHVAACCPPPPVSPAVPIAAIASAAARACAAPCCRRCWCALRAACPNA
jgi:hypothetical protein